MCIVCSRISLSQAQENTNKLLFKQQTRLYLKLTVVGGTFTLEIDLITVV